MNELKILEMSGALLQATRKTRPVVHHITNPVTMNDSANIVLAVGGSPVMAEDPEEVEEVASMASAVVLNTGMPNSKKLEAMILAGKRANALDVPIVLDPVGAGLTKLRRECLRKLLKNVRPAVIKGNRAEIGSLAGGFPQQKSLDSPSLLSDDIEPALSLAREQDCIVVMSGKTDIVTDGNISYGIDNGHAMLSSITGTGCMAASLIGSYCGSTSNNLIASIAGMLVIGICGEFSGLSIAGSKGTGSFKTSLFDNINLMDGGILTREGRIHELQR